jgi:hypothetical protein
MATVVVIDADGTRAERKWAKKLFDGLAYSHFVEGVDCFLHFWHQEGSDVVNTAASDEAVELRGRVVIAKSASDEAPPGKASEALPLTEAELDELAEALSESVSAADDGDGDDLDDLDDTAAPESDVDETGALELPDDAADVAEPEAEAAEPEEPKKRSRKKDKAPPSKCTAIYPFEDVPHMMRTSFRALLEPVAADIGMPAEQFETNFFRDVVAGAIAAGLFTSWEDPSFLRYYDRRAATVMANLDSLDPARPWIVLRKPQLWDAVEAARRVQESSLASTPVVQKDMLLDKYCDACLRVTKHTDYSVQIRSGDEGASVFEVCVECGRTTRED